LHTHITHFTFADGRCSACAFLQHTFHRTHCAALQLPAHTAYLQPRTTAPQHSAATTLLHTSYASLQPVHNLSAARRCSWLPLRASILAHHWPRCLPLLPPSVPLPPSTGCLFAFLLPCTPFTGFACFPACWHAQKTCPSPSYTSTHPPLPIFLPALPTTCPSSPTLYLCLQHTPTCHACLHRPHPSPITPPFFFPGPIPHGGSPRTPPRLCAATCRACTAIRAARCTLPGAPAATPAHTSCPPHTPLPTRCLATTPLCRFPPSAPAAACTPAPNPQTCPAHTPHLLYAWRHAA